MRGLSIQNHPSEIQNRKAATIVITRQAGSVSEVFLVKRHGRASFMPDFHVFPGGCLESQDYTLASRLEGDAEADERMAYEIAAIRETAEESGLLLARDADGAVPGAQHARQVFEALRDGGTFIDLMDEYALLPDLGALHPVGWWITPEAQRLRYDTRFFWAEAPPDQRATYDAVETTDALWMTAAAALDACRDAEITLAPPTLATLEQLRAAASPAAFAEAAARSIQPLLPQPTLDADGNLLLILPGDPLYPGDEPPALPHRTRFRILKGGRFA